MFRRSACPFWLGVQRLATRIAFLLLITAVSQRVVAEKVVYSFEGGSDGSYPYGTLTLDKQGNLYGTTAQGGAFGAGTVFQLTRSGTSWSEKVLYTFTGKSDGSNPGTGVVFDLSGNLWGNAQVGGASNNCGTVFELTPSSGGNWSEQTVHIFLGNGEDGCGAIGSLAADSNGNIFGTTAGGGIGASAGTAFELSPSGTGWDYHLLWSFDSFNGASPVSGVILDAAGNLYATTQAGGEFGNGTVVKISPAADGWTGTAIYMFTGGNNGCTPVGGVIFDRVGNLYGTAERCGADNVGLVFKLTPTRGLWDLSVIHTFTGGGADGAFPSFSLAFDQSGSLWGTTLYGGLYGHGTVFRLTPNRTGTWTETQFSFQTGNGGFSPSSAVTLAAVGSRTVAFGTTSAGGANGFGVVYGLRVN